MASRKKQKDETNAALWEAFARLKNGTPKVLKDGYNINPTSVQKEARRPYGTIAGHPDVENAVKEYKANQEAKKKGLTNEIDLLRQKIRDLRHKLNVEKRTKNDYREEKEAAESALEEETERTVSLVASLLALVPEEHKKKAANLVNKPKGNVVELRTRRTD